MPLSRSQLRDQLVVLVENSSLHDLIHALVDVCYVSADRERLKMRKAENWRRIAQALTAVERLAAPLDL